MAGVLASLAGAGPRARQEPASVLMGARARSLPSRTRLMALGRFSIMGYNQKGEAVTLPSTLIVSAKRKECVWSRLRLCCSTWTAW
jgi:hypothetical protein